MHPWEPWLRSLGQALWQEAPKAVTDGVPFGEDLPRIGAAFWEHLREAQPAEADHAALAALALATPEEVSAAAAAIAAEVAGDAPPEARGNLARTLETAPQVARRSLSRPEDPRGLSVPAALRLDGPRAVLPFVPPAPPRFQPGHEPVPGWVLEARLGAGGFAEVWKAHHKKNRALVAAFKFFLDDPGRQVFSEHEVAVVCQVQALGRRDGIVPLVDFNDEATATAPPWIRYEYVPGGDLVQHAERFFGPAATPLIERLARIVGACHRQEPPIVHRDLKPSNILLDGQGNPLVADFGIGGLSAAWTLAQEHVSTRPTAALPTLLVGSHSALYASPQQKAHERPDPRDDVYSLGVLWYQLLIGNLASDRPAGNWQRKLSALGPALIELLGDCCGDDPAERPADALVLAERIAADHEAIPVVVATPTPVPTTQPTTETAAAKVRRLREEVQRLHDDVKTLVEVYDYEAAAQVLESFTPDQVPFRVAQLYDLVLSRRGRLRDLDARIRKRLEAPNPNDPLLPGLLTEYLKLKPNNAEMNELAKELPPPQAGKTVLTNGLGTMLAYIPAGTFQMGRPESEKERDKDEARHAVTLTQPFYLGVHPVTVGEFARFVAATNYKTEAEQSGGAFGMVCGNWKRDASITWRTPGFAQTDRHPVVCVSWNDAQAMIAWLNEVEKGSDLVYALPTEAQWEYACRAGTTTAFWFGDDASNLGDYAWFGGNASNASHPVESKKPNPWGLYHTHGNVWEWCADWYGGYPSTTVSDPLGISGGSNRVNRGGAWHNDPASCSSAYRSYDAPSERGANRGFRVAASIPLS